MIVFTYSERSRSLTGLLLLLLGIFAFSPAFAQDDNPNRDQLPWSMRQQMQNTPQTDAPLSTVLTIDNWDNFNLGTDFGEGNIAANPAVPTWYFTAFNINTAHRTQNGLDWANSVPNFGASMQGDPVVAYDSLGNLYYENMYGSSSIVGVKVMKSADNGSTWGPSVTGVSGVDKNWLACDQTSGPYANYVYTCMTANSGGNFARSIDHGATFQTTFNPTTQSLPGMMVCVGPSGNVQGGAVYVVTNSGNSFASTYTFYRSTDGGQNFTMMSAQNFAGYVGSNVGGRNSVQNMRTRPYPFITADNSYGPHRGRLYLVYASNDPPGSGNKPDIWLRYSDNGGQTWSTTPKRINDDANPTTHHQWHPATWCDKETGKLYVQWMDTRDCPTNDSAMIYASYSTDGGTTFVTNQKISNKKMKIDCPTCGGGGTPRYQGDYNGIISNKKVSMANWTDFRNGSFMSVSAYFPDFAMATDKTTDTVYTPSDISVINISIPEVKLYSDTVVFTGSVFPIPTIGTITFTFPQGNTLTTFPGSKPVNIVVTGNVPPATYQVSLQGAGPNGTPVHKRLVNLKVMAGTGIIVDVTASPASICVGSNSQLNASVSGGTAPYTYSWTPTTGLSNPTIANPVATPLVSTWYKANVNDNGSNTGADSVFVVVEAAPSTPGTITGLQSVCADSSATYTIDAVTSASSYSWTVPAGATINSGQNTTSINCTFATAGGNVSVIAGNICGNSNPSVLAVGVALVPAAPAAINGPSGACAGATVIFSVDAVTGAESYTWTVPADATILSGQTTSELTVQWGTAAGDVTVSSLNSCGMSAATSKSITLDVIPDPAGTIAGPDTVCADQGNYTYSVPAIPQASGYDWTLPAGATITSGSGTNTITLSFSGTASSGNLTVAGSNTCGVGTSSSKAVTVRSCTGISDPSAQSVTIFPNPTKGIVTVTITGAEKQIEFQVVSISGQILQTGKWESTSGNLTKQVDISGLAKGIYYLKFTTNSKIYTEKIILQ